MEEPWWSPFLVKLYPATLLKKNSINLVRLLKILMVAILPVPKVADESEKDPLN